jgi:hypothetical protein
VIRQLVIGWSLMASNVAIHAAGVVGALRWLRGRGAHLWTDQRTWLFIGVAAWVILLHVVEIIVWGAAYRGLGAMPDFVSATYFSAVTYTTTGYGDLVLPQSWRLVGAIEALTGILMCGWSSGFFFAVLSRVLNGREEVSKC